jgi:2'-5' RNA ligase
VPALGVGELVSNLRLENDPSAKAGVPPHITLMFPFVPPAGLTELTIDLLASLIATAAQFDFALTRVSEFEQGLVYLEPDPAAPFVRLTGRIGGEFSLLPYGGAFGEHPIPHLTVAIPESGMTLRQVAGQLDAELPLLLRAEEAWLMVGSDAAGWRTIRTMPLGKDS